MIRFNTYRIEKIFLKDIVDKDFFNLAILILAAFLVRLIMLFSIDNAFGADTLNRLANGINVFKNKVFVVDIARLPLHSWLIAFSLWIYNDTFIVPRLLHIILGIATLVPFYWLVFFIFGKKAAVYSSLFLTFFPSHIRFSVLTLTEVPFIFFVISSLFFFYRYQRCKNTLNIVLSAVMLMFGCLIRYEGWLIAFLTGLYMAFLRRKNIVNSYHLRAYLAIVAIVPFFWFLISYKYTNNILDFAVGNIHLDFLEGFPPSFKDSLLYWPKLLYDAFGPVVFSLAIFGLFYFLFFKKNGRFISILFLSLFFFYVIGCLTRTVACHPEYILNAEVFLIPFVVSWVIYLFKKSIRKLFISILTIVCILILSCNSIKIIQGHNSNFDVHTKITFNYIKDNFDATKKVAVFFYSFTLEDFLNGLCNLMDAYSDIKFTKQEIVQNEMEIADYIVLNKPDAVICSRKTFNNFRNHSGETDVFQARPFWMAGDYIILRIFYN